MINRKRALPLGVLVVGLLVVLATIGVVSGLWSKNLVVDGTVETGDLSVDWTEPRCSENNPWPSGTNQGEYLGKDVGDFDWEIGDAEFGDQVLRIKLSNTYPSYFVDCELHWINNGTIPVNFIGAAIVPGAGRPPIGPGPNDCHLVVAGANSALNCPQLTVRFIDGTGQVDPCDDQDGDGDFDEDDIALCRVAHSLEIHVEQPAEQSDCRARGSTSDPWQIDRASLQCNPDTQVSYEFQVKLCVAQWNENASFPDCVDSVQHEGPPGPGDGDGVPYWLDPDDDNDCIPDAADPAPFDFNDPIPGGDC
jgi:hypothetical protein